MKKYRYVAAIMVATMIFTACGNNAGSVSEDEVITESVVSEENGNNASENDSDGAFTGSLINKDKQFSDRDLSGEYDVSECKSIKLLDNGSSSDAKKGVAIDENTITITKEGDYILEGSLSDGMIIVDVDKSEKVQLVLNGVSINSETSAAIYVNQADKVFVTLADGTENTLSNGGEFVELDDTSYNSSNIDAVIFSKDDLTLNGTGSLTINSPVGHGVVSKNDLVITGGIYNVTAGKHGFSGKDSVAVANGTLNVTAGKDGIHSENDDDDEAGLVYIENGDFNFSVESDGISAVNEIYVADGKIKITKSYEGLEARIINICGGVVDITSSDDGLNATDKRSTAENQNSDRKDFDPGDFDMSQFSQEDLEKIKEAFESGEMPEDMTLPEGMTMPEMPEGMELGEMPEDMTMPENSDDFNGGGKMGGGPGGGGFGGGGDPMGDTQSDANINISGGVVYINAEGDGVDSNGYFTMSGGELYVMGPSNSGNGALDYGIDAAITGGIVVAAGQSGMAVNFGSDSTQGSMLVNTSSQNDAGTKIVLLDSDGNKLIEWTMEKRYNSVVISCPEIVDGGTYTVEMGDTSTEVTMDGLIYGDGFGMGGGFGGGHGGDGMRGDRGGDKNMEQPDQSDKPDNGGKDEAVTGRGREIPIEGDSNNTKKE
jgi:hypothetical protein